VIAVRRLLVTLLLTLLAAQAWAQSDPVEIKLDHLTLRWNLQQGLTVQCDGRDMLGGSVSPIVAYPPGWAWSYTPEDAEAVTARLSTEGASRVLRVELRDAKIWGKQVITAGPGDRFTIGYWFSQKGWDTPVNYEACLCQPATSWFVGAKYTATGPGLNKQGVIPLKFGGEANPIAGATKLAFDGFQGRLTIATTAPVTLFDYAHRQSLWLGRDAPFPKGLEQHWAGEFTFEPQPFEVAGVRLANARFPDQTIGENLEVALDLSRVPSGPGEVTARLVYDDEQAPAAHERTVTLGAKPTTVKLAVQLPGPGRQSAHLELLAQGKELYRSPSFSFLVPRFLSLTSAKVPFARGERGAVLATVDKAAGQGLRLVISGPVGDLATAPVVAGERNEVAVPLTGLALGFTEVKGTLYRGATRVGSATCELLVAEPKATGVAVDHRSQTLVVNGLPFVAQACYADVTTVDQVAETEAPWAFNLMSPYLTNDLAERRQYRAGFRKFMDRCAEVGVRVQLGMLLASHAPQDEAKWAFVKEEVEAFRDHPALLSYYLADEPELGWAKPEECEAGYRRLKELDPWHPVTMVFCQAAAAARYAKGMDICMTDPYPVPNGPITSVTDFCTSIRHDLADSMPLWVVPQTFGGGEWWRREPSRQEERVMTYLSLIHGAKGIQYFIRRPVVVNPTSPDLWSECRRLMLELSQLVPALASPEKPPVVRCDAPPVNVAAFRERGAITVLCANVTNQPLPFTVTLDQLWTGKAEVLFENRTVAVDQGRLRDMIDAFGTRAYRLQVSPAPADRVKLADTNLIFNGSFEEAHNVATPDGSYLGQPADLASSWFVDPRLAVQGRQSLRLRVPVEGKGISVLPFPIQLTPGKRYRMSVWARGERAGQRFSLSLDAMEGQAAEHALTTDWAEYATEFTASTKADRMSAELSLLSAGSAWFDALQVVPLK
jgi:hypothetical protein